MFKNRSLRIQVVKDPQTDAPFPPASTVRRHPVEYLILTKMAVRDVALIAGAGYAAKKVLDTGAEIALIVANHKFK
jgi:hypothetical protein